VDGGDAASLRTLYIDEPANNGTFLCLVSISDADSVNNAKFEWNFYVEPDDGSIRELAILNNVYFNSLLRDENGAARKVPRHQSTAADGDVNNAAKTFARCGEEPRP